MWICGKGEESLKHILKKCEAIKDEISIEEFFSEKGNGLNRYEKRRGRGRGTKSSRAKETQSTRKDRNKK